MKVVNLGQLGFQFGENILLDSLTRLKKHLRTLVISQVVLTLQRFHCLIHKGETVAQSLFSLARLEMEICQKALDRLADAILCLAENLG